MDGKINSLSVRINELINMVPNCDCLYDVGCDHGYSSVSLVQQKKCKKAYAMDVRKGPLCAAIEHISAAGLDDKIKAVLSDGLKEIPQVENNSCILISGMGGELMSEIISEALDNNRLQPDTCMVLQPQSELPRFRAFLYEKGFVINDEKAVYEDGKYYFLMKVAFGNGNIDSFEEAFGPILLKKRDEVLKDYLGWKLDVHKKVEKSLFAHGESEKSRARLIEVDKEVSFYSEALEKYYKN